MVDAARQLGRKIVLVRHPMPYGDLAKQAVQRFESLDDLDKHNTTIEEREEYEQHIKNGVVVYAGVVSWLSSGPAEAAPEYPETTRYCSTAKTSWVSNVLWAAL